MVDTRREDFMSALRADMVREIAQATGAPEGHAINIAARILRAVQLRYQGERVYVPAPRCDEDAVLRDFDGSNHRAVCRDHQISRATLYRLIAQRKTTDTTPLKRATG